MILSAIFANKTSPSYIKEIIENGKCSCIEKLIDSGKSTKLLEFMDNGFTPLSWAICRYQKKAANLLINYGIGVNMLNKDGETPLLCASQRGMASIAGKLVKLTDNNKIDATDAGGNTALIWATRFNDLNLIKNLVRKGAKIDVCNNEGTTPLLIAENNRKSSEPSALEVFRFLNDALKKQQSELKVEKSKKHLKTQTQALGA